MIGRKALQVSVVAALGASALGVLPAPVGAAPKSKAIVVAKDDVGDWGNNQQEALAPLGDPLGSDLTEASIEKADAKTLNFIIKVNALPESGGVPEFVRYVWTMTVNNELVQLDGKFTNYTRGACDPTGGTCPPPRDPGEAPFMVRGNCVDQQAAVTCEELGLVNATFDAAAATITVPVPMELIGAKPGAKIRNGTQPGSNFTGVWAIPSAWASQADMPKDEMIITKTYKVARK